MPPKNPRAFIVHGRDLDARNLLQRLLEKFGLSVDPFERVVEELGALPFVSDVVRAGIETADLVVVLFTPDEFALLFNPETGLFDTRDRDSGRWQARPNVIFEAGWAFGARREETIFVTLGDDTSLFSDAAGLHVIRLESHDAHSRIASAIEHALGSRFTPCATGGRTWTADERQRLVRSRPRFHDEIAALRLALANIDVRGPKGKRKKGAKKNRSSGEDAAGESLNLLGLVAEVAVAKGADPDWSWPHRHPIDLISAIRRNHGFAAADTSYWWLVATGFFQYSDIEYWGNSYSDSIEQASFSPRGLALLEWLRERGQRVAAGISIGRPASENARLVSARKALDLG